LEQSGRYEEAKEKLQKEAEEWRRKYQETVLRYEIATKAQKAGVVDTKLLMTLVSDKAKITENGEVLVDGKHLKDFLNKLKEKKPYLFQFAKGS
jgi:hypothetical protein